MKRDNPAPPVVIRKKSPWRAVWLRFRKNVPAMIGLFMLLFLVLVSGTANLWLDYDAQAVVQNMRIRLQPPSAEHIFGTDQFGRDVFARVVFGARISMLVGLVTITLALSIGSLIGSVAGFYGGRVGNVLMRCMDVLLSIPAILLAISIVAALGNGVVNLIIALTVSSVPRFAYIVRSTVLTIKDQEFIEAARAYGSPNSRIILRHVMPNVMGIMTVQATTNMANSILLISSLSFVGLGLSSSIPEWGAMLSTAKQYMRHNAYLIFFPGVAIVTAVMALNLIGDGLRDALDPKLKN